MALEEKGCSVLQKHITCNHAKPLICADRHTCTHTNTPVCHHSLTMSGLQEKKMSYLSLPHMHSPTQNRAKNIFKDSSQVH